MLDFQSLYPSIIIAYNLCYSTCLGKVTSGQGVENAKRLGVSRVGVPRGLLGLVQVLLLHLPIFLSFIS